MSASSFGALSRFEPYGGAWKLKIARCGSATWATSPSIRSRSSGSGSSRNVSHGVGLAQPVETSVKPSSSMVFASPSSRCSARSMIGSISNMSSLAGETMQRMPVPASRSSPSAIQRSTEASISALNRVSTRVESADHASISSRVRRTG